VYPSPYDLSRPGGITFSAPSAIKEVRIYTLGGKLVKKPDIPPGTTVINRDGTNEKGNKADRGVYLYSIKSTEGNTTKDKLAITK
jgi:flagellar hook assembly protein FlgD